MSNLDLMNIQSKIYSVRGLPVMLDFDLALLYKIPTGRLNEQVKRNSERFPDEFCFKLTVVEVKELISQFATSNEITPLQKSFSKSRGGRTKLPYAFNEQGVAMLSAVLKSDIAVYMSIRIINAFVSMRKVIANNTQIIARLDHIEQKQFDIDKQFEKVFNALSSQDVVPPQKIFFDGQVFDAHEFVSKVIRSAKTSIILIDNFIDESVLKLFTKRRNGVQVVIYTKNVNELVRIDVEKFKAQYGNIELKEFNLSHDRFLIIDNEDIYHFGASIKDLGKKWFACSKFNKQALLLLDMLG